MNKIYLIIALVFTVGLGVGLSVNASGEKTLIPSWIKTTAGFWVDDKVSDSEFISALQFLVEKGVLVIPQKGNVPNPTPTVTANPNSINSKYQPNIEAFYEQGTDFKVLVSIVNNVGTSVKVNGDVTIKILDFDEKEIFNEKKYIVSNSFEDFTNIMTSKKVTGFEFNIPTGKIKTNSGLGTMKVIFTDSTQSYENEISLSHTPINEGFFNAKTGFINNIKVDKILDVGPFFVTVKDAGQYMGEKDNKPKEFFRVNLTTKFKIASDVNFKLTEIYIMDQNDKMYSLDGTSISDLENVFMGKSYEYQGGNGYVLFEKIPSDTSKIKLILKLTVVNIDLSETPYHDDLEISLK